MDQFVVDLGGDEPPSRARGGAVRPGDRGEPTAEDWARAAGTIAYEIVTRIGTRVPRVYVKVTTNGSAPNGSAAEHVARDVSDERGMRTEPDYGQRAGEEERYVSESTARRPSWTPPWLSPPPRRPGRKLAQGAGFAGAAIGVVAAGAAAGVAIERLTVGRGMRRRARLALDAAGPYGTLRGTPGKAYADDGTELYYEVDEVEPEAPARARAGAGSSAARPPPPSPSSSATATASTRTPGTSSGPRCAAWSAPCTGTSAATGAPGGARPRWRAARRSPSTSSAAT